MLRDVSYRVEHDTGVVLYEGSRTACILFLALKSEEQASLMSLISNISGRAESWRS